MLVDLLVKQENCRPTPKITFGIKLSTARSLKLKKEEEKGEEEKGEEEKGEEEKGEEEKEEEERGHGLWCKFFHAIAMLSQ